MRSRLLAGIAAAFALLTATGGLAAPLYGNDPDGMFGAGRPGGNLFGGSSPVPRTTVTYPTNHKPGTIVVNTAERRLYLVLGNGQALRYGIGVGRDGFTWSGVKTVTSKREWPSWTPPEQMLRRRPDLPRFMPGGPDNPLGARALYLGSTLYRIHGSNEPETIGQAVSSGCFRLTNEDVIDLYERVNVGATVVVQQH
jgi:lipoprotein-anchoring transpeptidase ErfK/SrfK